MNRQAPSPITAVIDEEALLVRLGDRVRAARARLGIPRRVLADRSGVSARYLAQLEGGHGNMSVILLARVATALEVDLTDLLAETEISPEEYRLLEAWRHGTPEARSEALTCLRRAEERAERVCLIGLRGAGKSTLGKMVAERLGAPFVQLNDQIEATAGMPVAEVIALTGPEGYRRLEAAALDHVIATRSRVVLEAAGGIVSDAATYDRMLGRFHAIWMRARPEDHMARVRAQGDMRPMQGNPLAMAQLRGILASREADYRRAEAEFDTSGKTVDQSTDALADLLQSRGFLSGQPVD